MSLTENHAMLINPQIGKEKKTKDENAPKRAMSAFFCYQKTRREALTKENPSMDNKKIVSV